MAGYTQLLCVVNDRYRYTVGVTHIDDRAELATRAWGLFMSVGRRRMESMSREIEAMGLSRAMAQFLGAVCQSPPGPTNQLATRFGVAAMNAVAAGHFGAMVALRGTDIIEVPLEDALREPKLLDPELFRTAELFFG